MSSDTTLEGVKLMLLELLGLHPLNSALYIRGELAMDDSRTLAGRAPTQGSDISIPACFPQILAQCAPRAWCDLISKHIT